MLVWFVYFLYIYCIMKGLEKRLIVIPQGKFGNKTFVDFIAFVKGVIKTIDTIDSDLYVKQNFEQVMLKEKRIKQFKGKNINEFHQDMVNQVMSNGTQFLISKN